VSRFTVGLEQGVARQVEQDAKTTDTSMSRATVSLVQIGLEGQETRKQAFFKKLKGQSCD